MRHRLPSCLLMLALATPALGDSSSPALASYYDRHMAIVGSAAYGWQGSAAPRRMRDGVLQVGVGRDTYLALLADGSLLSWADAGDAPRTLMRDVSRFAAGRSGWFAIDRNHRLWHGSGDQAPKPVAEDVIEASIGDSADYYITRDGRLHVKGLAHRGQYGDGRSTPTADYVVTASDANSVKAHTGHAIHLRRDGTVMGTGGNRYGPLSSWGLGDKADRWGRIFDGAAAIATGSRHSAAIRADGSLWVWGGAFPIEPTRVFENVSAVAAGDSATIVLTRDGTLWQWDGAGPPRRLKPG